MAAPPREPPWHDKEKIWLLAEVIKTHTTHPSHLLNVIDNLRLPSIRWEDVILPGGRTLSSCRYAYEDLRRQYQTYPSQSPPGIYAPQLGPPTGMKRQLQPEGSGSSGSAYQAIRPKPALASGPYGQAATSSEPPTKRKRGRPPKAVVQRRQEEEKARLESARPSAATPVQQMLSSLPPPPMPLPAFIMPEESRPTSAAPSTRMHISAMLTPAPPKSASQSSSSSGKRRRARSNRSELGQSRDPQTSSRDDGSPYSRRNTATAEAGSEISTSSRSRADLVPRPGPIRPPPNQPSQSQAPQSPAARPTDPSGRPSA